MAKSEVFVYAKAHMARSANSSQAGTSCTKACLALHGVATREEHTEAKNIQHLLQRDVLMYYFIDLV